MNRNSYRWQRIMDEALKYRILCWRYGAEPEAVLERVARDNSSQPEQGSYDWLGALQIVRDRITA